MKHGNVYDANEPNSDRKSKKRCIVNNDFGHTSCPQGHDEKEIFRAEKCSFTDEFYNECLQADADRRKSRDKKKKKSRRSELEAIISKIHTNLACREALNGRQFSTDVEPFHFSGSSQSYLKTRSSSKPALQEPHLRRNLSCENGYEDIIAEAGDVGAKSSRIYSEKFTDDHLYLGDDYQHKSTRNRNDKSNRDARDSRRKQDSNDKSLLYEDIEYPNILDENVELFRQLKALERVEMNIHEQKHLNGSQEVTKRENIEHSYKPGTLKLNFKSQEGMDSYFDDPIVCRAINHSLHTAADNNFCDIIYDDNQPENYGLIDNVTYFTAREMAANSPGQILLDDNGEEFDIPDKRQRVTGRRDRGVWSDTLFESNDGVSAGTRVEGREAGWWRATPSKKDNGREPFLLKSSFGKRSGSNSSKDQACGPGEPIDCSPQKESHQPKLYKILKKTGSKRFVDNDRGDVSTSKNVCVPPNSNSLTLTTIGPSSALSPEGTSLPETAMTVTTSPEAAATLPPTTPQVK